MPATVVPSDDGTYAWLFPTDPMPGGSTIQVTVDGSSIKDAGGAPLDAGGTGTPGSKLTWTFQTVSLVPLPDTSISGIVADPGPDLTPGTFDDVRGGPDGVVQTADDVYLHPLAGVTVTVIGVPGLTMVTGADGRFSFDSIPAGDVKLAVDGRTATNAPAGVFFPEMVLDLTILPGSANTVQAAMQRTQGGVSGTARTSNVPGMYLPRVNQNTLQTVSSTATTHVGLVDAEAGHGLTAVQQTRLFLDVPPNSLIGPDGRKMAGGQIGISVVPPELVMDMLPPGVMQHTFDITIQAPGVATFSTPVPMSFPNVFHAAPGTKLSFLSFDHTTGRLAIEGSATVSADGLSVVTDPGTGITHPGWHGLVPPNGSGGGGGGGGGGGPGGPNGPNDKECDKRAQLLATAEVECRRGRPGHRRGRAGGRLRAELRRGHRGLGGGL